MSAATPAAAQPQAENPLYKGSCHCGYVRYRVRLNLASPGPQGAILTKCNCTICHKSGMVGAAAAPASSFSILSPEGGETALPDYQFNSRSMHHRFCPHCGIKCFVRGAYELHGKMVETLNINALTLDGREDGEPMESLKDIKIRYWDGREDMEGFMKGLADEPWGFGTW